MNVRNWNEALARACARRPWVTVSIWIVAIVLAVFAMSNWLGDALVTDVEPTNNPESSEALELMNERLGISEYEDLDEWRANINAVISRYFDYQTEGENIKRISAWAYENDIRLVSGRLSRAFGNQANLLSTAQYVDAKERLISLATRTPVCGDGRVDSGEQCDDGNDVGGDGCETTCLLTVLPLGDSRDRPPTGLWFSPQTPAALAEAVRRFEGAASELSRRRSALTPNASRYRATTARSGQP